MHPDETKRDFIDLRCQGYSLSYSARMLGISTSTAFEWDKAAKAKVAQFREDEMLAVYNKYGLYKIDRLSSLGKLHKQLEKAVDTRFSLDADKLITGGTLTVSDTKSKVLDDTGCITQEDSKEQTEEWIYGINSMRTKDLISLHLKTLKQISDEYVPVRDEAPQRELCPENVVYACAEFVEQVRNGELTGEQAKLEAQGITSLVKALELATQRTAEGANISSPTALPPMDKTAPQNGSEG